MTTVESGAEISGNRILGWIKQRLARTYIMSGSFPFPRSANPLSCLGFLAFICFILLGLTGVLLQIYYVPESSASYDSVMKINYEIPYGFEIRNLHYWLANFMIILVVAHFFYLYFARSYRLKNEILWVTGMVAGVLTILATYTGYVLIMSTRAMMAIEIGSGILNSVHASLSDLLTGVSLTDTIVRMYTLHVVIIPAIMVIFFLVHFPRRLIVNAPAILATIGGALLVGGVVPVDLGSRYVEYLAYFRGDIVTPEWYLAGIYAILRTGAQVFIATVLLPFTLIFIFILIAFYDRALHLGVNGHVFHTTIGLVAMAHIAFITIWGFRAGDFLHPIKSLADLPIDPVLFYGYLILTAMVIFGATALSLLFSKKWLKVKTLFARMSFKGTRGKVQHRLSESITLLLMCIVLLLEIALFLDVFWFQPLSSRGLPMTESGAAVLGFATATYLYRAADSFSK